jgi:hypothetical protein
MPLRDFGLLDCGYYLGARFQVGAMGPGYLHVIFQDCDHPYDVTKMIEFDPYEEPPQYATFLGNLFSGQQPHRAAMAALGSDPEDVWVDF